MFEAGGGIVSGNGTVSSLYLGAGGGTWTFTGAISAGLVSISDDTTVYQGGSLILTGAEIFVYGEQAISASLSIGIGDLGPYIPSVVQSTVTAQTAGPVLIVGSDGSLDSGTVVVEQNSSLILGGNAATVGAVGTGNLNVLGASYVLAASADSSVLPALSIGDGGVGTVNLSGFSHIVAKGAVSIGRGGRGTLAIEDNSVFTGGSAATGTAPAYGITIGDGSPAPASPLLGGTGSVQVQNGTIMDLGDLIVGDRGATGNLLSQLFTVRVAGELVIGAGTDHTGSIGTLTVADSLFTSGAPHEIGVSGIVLGADAGTSGVATVIGTTFLSTLATTDRLTVGEAGSGALMVSHGAVYAGSNFDTYSDLEAALAVAALPGSVGSVTITGSGSQLLAFAGAVIGGTDFGAGPVAGGAGVVSVADHAEFQTGAVTIEANSSLTVDQTSSLVAPSITLNGGTADLFTLSTATPISFGDGGTLRVHAVSGANTIGTFSFGDVIDFAGTTAVTWDSNTLSTANGSITVGPAPANSSYQLNSDGDGGIEVSLTPQTVGVYRFFDAMRGTQFLTAIQGEAADLTTPGSSLYRSDLIGEANGFGAYTQVSDDRNEVQVFRFFHTVQGTEFLTDSQSEASGLMTPGSSTYRPDLALEPNGSIYEHATQQPGDVPVYRFFDTTNGTHFYTGSPSEHTAITTAGSFSFRPDLAYEGVAFNAPGRRFTP